MTEFWLTSEELTELTEWPARTIRGKAERRELKWRYAKERRANGRRFREYSSLGLPIEIQLKLNARSLAPVPADRPAQQSSGAELTPFRRQLAPVNVPGLAITAAQKEQVAARLPVVLALLEFNNLASSIEREHWCRLNNRTANGVDDLVKQLAREQGRSAATIYLWLKNYKAHAERGLCDRVRSDKGQSRWAAKSEQHAELAQIAVFARLQENLSARMCWEIACEEAERGGILAPSYETIRQLLENIPAPIKTLALKGRRKYDEIFAPYVRRGYEDMQAGEILVSDHAIHDVLVQNDLFDKKDRGHMRLRFTGLLDMRSRKFVGYAWSQEGSSRSIVTCLRHAIQRFGAPRLFYCDNGKDYQKVGRGARSVWNIEELELGVRGVIAQLGIQIQYCQPFHPQSKLIERANNTLHQRFDRRWMTYTGPTPEQRPDQCIAALERHKKLLTAGHPEDSDLPLASEFIRAAVLWIEGDYHRTSKDVAGMEGLTPDEAFERFRWAEQSPPPPPHILAQLLAERTSCKVQECAITLGGRRYVTNDGTENRMMHYHTGKRVTVAYDPLDLDSAVAFDDEGKPIAYLHPEQLLRHSNDEETRAAVGANMQLRRSLHRDTRDQLDELSRNVRSTGYLTQHERMTQLGRLPLGIDGLVVHRPQKSGVKPAEQESQSSLLPGEAADRLTERLQRRKCVNS